MTQIWNHTNKIFDWLLGSNPVKALTIGHFPVAEITKLGHLCVAHEFDPATAATLPFPSKSMGAVLINQPTTWLGRPGTSVELARVLKNGGTLGLVWEDFDLAVPWIAKFQTLTGHTESVSPEALLVKSGMYERVETRTIRNWRRVKVADLQAMAPLHDPAEIADFYQQLQPGTTGVQLPAMTKYTKAQLGEVAAPEHHPEDATLLIDFC